MIVRDLVGRGVREMLLRADGWMQEKHRPSVLLSPWTGRDGGSSELRCIKLAPYLRSMGWRTLTMPFQLGLSQRQRLARMEKPDVVLIQKSRHPCNRPRFYPGVPVVFDIDDADFADDRIVDSVRECCEGSASVIAGSEFVAEWCRQYNGDVHVIWTGNTPPKKRPGIRPSGRKAAFGWAHSSPSAYPKERALVCSILKELGRRGVVCEFWVWGVKSVGEVDDILAAAKEAKIEVRTFAPMAYEAFLESLGGLAVGLQPVILDNPFSTGKSFGKILGYLAADVPIVASNNVDHPKFFTHGVDGFLADTVEEWADAIERLLVRPEVRDAMADAAWYRYNEELTLDVAAMKVDRVIRKYVRAR